MCTIFIIINFAWSFYLCDFFQWPEKLTIFRNFYGVVKFKKIKYIFDIAYCMYILYCFPEVSLFINLLLLLLLIYFGLYSTIF